MPASQDERNLCGVAAAVVPSAIHAPLTGLFFIATAPERSTQAAERFSPPGNGDTRKQGEERKRAGKKRAGSEGGSLWKTRVRSAAVSRDKVGGDTGGE